MNARLLAWVATVAGLATAAAIERAPVPVQPAPPSIVFILADDLSEPVLDACLANGWCPNIQALIDAGMRFCNSFVSDSLCCPGRATCLTGQYNQQTKVWSNAPPLGGVTVFDDSSTVATWLRAAGYDVAMIGHYLTGSGTDQAHSTPSLKDDPEYIPPGWSNWQAVLQPPPGSSGMYEYDLNDNGTIVHYGSAPADYQTDVIKTRAVAYLSSIPPPTPFFLWITPQAPHWGGDPICTLNYGTLGTIAVAPRHQGITASLPLPRPPSFNVLPSNPPTWLQNLYGTPFTPEQVACITTAFRDQAGALIALDELVGAVVSALGDRLPNTYVVLGSDNGLVLGPHQIAGIKMVAYEESIRVPLVIRGPGVLAGQTTTRFAVNTDYAPTIVEWAQATAGLPMDGRSLVPVLGNATYSPWRDLFYTVHRYSVTAGYGGVRSAPTYAPAPNALYVEYTPAANPNELYDLTADPWQNANLWDSQAPPYPAWRTALAAMLAQLKTCAGDACRALEDQ